MKYEIEDLVRVAKRDNNTRRPYLYVNPIQGKHIPANPQMFKIICKELAAKIEIKHLHDKMLVIGFAETATAIAAEVALNLRGVKYFQCTTRENLVENAEWVCFSETHSHAPMQKLDIKSYERILEEVDRVVFVEDEVTTGNTILKLIEILKEISIRENIAFSIASLLNSMTEEREKELETNGYDCIYIKKLPYEYLVDSIDKVVGNDKWGSIADERIVSSEMWNEFQCGVDQRRVHEIGIYQSAISFFVDKAYNMIADKIQGSILVIGTEEFMHPAISLAAEIRRRNPDIHVFTHSTTRSPIIPSDNVGYPLSSRIQLKSAYDEERITYIYNLSCYDLAVIVTDAIKAENVGSLYSALYKMGNRNIVIFKW